MERRFELRKEVMLAECDVAPQVFRGTVQRLSKFVARKRWTPVITVPQIRDGVAMLLRAAYQCDTPTKIANNKTRRLM